MASRDWDLLEEVGRVLSATSEFDEVKLCSTPELSGLPTSEAFAVGVEIASRTMASNYDAGDSIRDFATLSLTLTFLGRHEDALIRDRTLDRLVSVAEKALLGASLLGLTILDLNAFTAHQWRPATPPERRVVSTFKCVYLIDGLASYDTSE